MLQAHGLDDTFFNAKLKQSKLSRFAIPRDQAMANLVTRLIGCLIALRNQSSQSIDPDSHIVALARTVVLKILGHLDVSNLDNETAVELGSDLARLFFEYDLLGLLFPVDLVEDTIKVWGTDEQLLRAVYCIVKNINVVEDVEHKLQSYTWLPEWKGLTKPDGLKTVISRMIATHWLQGPSFWTSTDMQSIFKWFSCLPEVGLVDRDVREEGFDRYRTIGLFTPPNWRRIEAWVKKNIHIHDQCVLDIQTAAVLCAFGDHSETPSELLLKYESADADWRVFIWLAEATSWRDLGQEFDYVHKCLDAIFQQTPERSAVVKAMASLDEWMGHWQNARKEFEVRKRIVALNQLIPGVMSYRLHVRAIQRAVLVYRAAGFDFFKGSYESNEQFMLETLTYEASDNFMHIALSQTLAEDMDCSRLSLLSEAYRISRTLCGELPDLSEQARRVARMKLCFWLGRLHFLHPDTSKLKEAIKIWEEMTKGFMENPIMGDVEIMLPVITFLCSAYIRDVLDEPMSANADGIVEKVKTLHTVAGFSQDSLTLKLRFRVSLCLARLHMARDMQDEAREVLKDHAAFGFAMIYQINNLPLASIGWFYLASILTIVDKDRAAWAWSKVAMHQQDRWFDFRKYKQASNMGPNPPLDEDLAKKLSEIQKGEEFDFWNGADGNNITSTFPDDRYLPTYASMACEGRQCRFDPTNTEAGFHNWCEPLQVAFEYPWPRGSFSPAQVRHGRTGPYWSRIGIWVCRDCISIKLCETCYEHRQNGMLPAMGCSADHSGVYVEGSGRSEDPYAIKDGIAGVKDLEADWAR